MSTTIDRIIETGSAKERKQLLTTMENQYEITLKMMKKLLEDSESVEEDSVDYGKLHKMLNGVKQVLIIFSRKMDELKTKIK